MKIKECPCCKGIAKVTDKYPDPSALTTNGFQVICKECGLQTCWWRFKKDAIDNWNKRTPIAQQQISGSADASPILKTCENCHEYQAGCENYSGKVCERWVESF